MQLFVWRGPPSPASSAVPTGLGCLWRLPGTYVRAYLYAAPLGLRAFGHDLRKICDRGKFFQKSLQEREPVRAQQFVLNHDHHFVEEGVYRTSRGGQKMKRAFVVARL